MLHSTPQQEGPSQPSHAVFCWRSVDGKSSVGSRRPTTPPVRSAPLRRGGKQAIASRRRRRRLPVCAEVYISCASTRAFIVDRRVPRSVVSRHAKPDCRPRKE